LTILLLWDKILTTAGEFLKGNPVDNSKKSIATILGAMVGALVYALITKSGENPIDIGYFTIAIMIAIFIIIVDNNS